MHNFINIMLIPGIFSIICICSYKYFDGALFKRVVKSNYQISCTNSNCMRKWIQKESEVDNGTKLVITVTSNCVKEST